MANSYVGGFAAGTNNGTQLTCTFLTDVGTALSENDLVVVTVGIGTVDRTPTAAVDGSGGTTSGYTSLSQQNVNDAGSDLRHCVSYKFMGGTPDTTCVLPASGNAADGMSYVLQVFRGVDIVTPLDGVTPTYDALYGSGIQVNPAAITPSTAGAWIICGGSGAAGDATAAFSAGELTNFLTANGPDSTDCRTGQGYKSDWASGEWNPAAWTGGSTSSTASWAATTLVLRPAGASAASLRPFRNQAASLAPLLRF